MYDISKVVKIATEEIGYLEKKKIYRYDDNVLNSKTAGAGYDNITKYWRDLSPNSQGNAWCNCFVDWIFEKAYGREAAKKLLCTPGSWSFYTPTSSGYFKNNNRWYTSPEIGDIIYFHNGTRICHVGLVIGYDSKKVYTIEGNTSSSSGVEPNGGMVRQKAYNLPGKNLGKGYYIAGYGRPNYGDTAPEKSKTRPTLSLGSTGDDVVYLHKQLRKASYGVSENNNRFDELTERCVTHLQASNYLEADGIVGKKTWAIVDKL